MAKSPNWSTQELDILCKIYPLEGISDNLLKSLPLRNSKGINVKASRLGLKVINNKPWERRTSREYNDLLENTAFESLEEYRGTRVPIMHRCKKCNNEWLVRPNQILKANANCPKCNIANMRNSTEEVEKVLSDRGIELLSAYINRITPITIKHTYCGNIWSTAYANIVQGTGCPICNRGYGYSYSKENIPEKALIYLLKISIGTEEFIKVGVTSKPTLNYRITNLKSELNKHGIVQIEVLKYALVSGTTALIIEKEILNKYKRYTSEINFAGKTELLDMSNISINQELLKELDNV